MADVDTIMAEAVDYGFSRFSTARRLSLLNQAYQYINSIEAWPYLQAVDTTVDYTDSTVTKPTNFLRVITLYTDEATAGGISKVEYLPVATLRKVWDEDSADTDTKARWYIYEGDPVADALKVYPGLGSAVSGTLHMRYTRAAADLVSAGAESTILVPARHHAVLRYGLLHELFLLEKDVPMAEHFRGLRDEKILSMRRDLLEESYDPDFIEVPQDGYYLDHYQY